MSDIKKPDAALAKYIDHTVLRPDATAKEVEQLCKEAAAYGFASVCVNPARVKYAATELKGTDVEICTVIGFPLGANTPKIKAAETQDAIENGATEVDMVINIGALKDGNLELVEDDIRAVVEAASGKALVKVIIETCLLTDDEKKTACVLSKKAGADYVKTSTGFGKGGATTEDVALMRSVAVEPMGVKASAGIRDKETATAMIKAGASRLGTSSGIKIISG